MTLLIFPKTKTFGQKNCTLLLRKRLEGNDEAIE